MLGQQPQQFLLDHRVAFARTGLQSRALEHLDVAAAVTDDAGTLQVSGSLGNPFPPHAEHARDQFLRHHQLARRDPVESEQQPAAQLLLHRMVPVADRRLGHLRHQRLRVAQQQLLQQAGAIELLPEHAGRQPIGMSGRLHHGRTRGGAATHEQRDADHAFVADPGGLRHRA